MKLRKFIATTIREYLNENINQLEDSFSNKEYSKLNQTLDKERAERQLKELSFKVLPSQKESVIKYLIKGYWNFEQSNGTIFCIGGNKYDLNKVIIDKDGSCTIIKK
jgi:hypothetical protein